MRTRAAIATAVARPSVIALLAMTAIACGGEPRDLGTIAHRDPEFDMDAEWKVVEVAGLAPSSESIQADVVDVDADGATATVLFKGGDPSCYAVTGFEIERHDPDVPDIWVRYGMRLGVFGCNAALANLAIRMPLEPPMEAPK
jgi:hypothetical protein